MLFGRSYLGKGFAKLREVEQRIITKTAIPMIFAQKNPAGFATHYKLATVGENTSNGTNVCPTALLFGNVPQIVKQALIVALVVVISCKVTFCVVL